MKIMKIVQHNPVAEMTVIIDKIGFKWYKESTVPIRVGQGDLAHPTCGGANQCQNVSEGEKPVSRDCSCCRHGHRLLRLDNVLVPA